MPDEPGNGYKSPEIKAERTFRAPAVDIAEIRNAIPLQRNVYSRAGCLSFLFAIVLAVVAGFFVASDSQWKAGLVLLSLSVILWRWRPVPGTFIGAIGLALAVHGGIELLGGTGIGGDIIFSILFLIIGFAWFWSTAGPTPVYSELSKQADYRCTIAYFRPFTAKHARDARNLVVPLLDGYGRVIHVNDLTFESVDQDYLHGQEYSDVLGKFRMRTQARNFDDANWQVGVQKILSKVDIAVVDISNLSPNVLWELANCYAQLPQNRVLGIVRSRNPQQDVERFADLSLKLEPFGIDKNIRPYVLMYFDEVEGRVWFMNALHQTMLKIAQDSPAVTSIQS